MSRVELAELRLECAEAQANDAREELRDAQIAELGLEGREVLDVNAWEMLKAITVLR